MAAIRQGGAPLKSAAARPAPAPSRGGGFLDAIRKGPSLKNASDRKLADRPAETNQRENMLSALRSGVSLKKAANRKLKAKKEPEAEQSNNIFALMKMRELIQDSDEEDDSEDDSWDS